MYGVEGSFARKQLEKHGWTEGAGLGAREHGISQAIRVKIKHDTAGVGHDAAKEFTHHWWDQAFNKAAASIIVEDGEDGVVVRRKQKNRKEGTEVAKKSLYSNFIKSSLLTNGTETAMEREDIEQDSSDEETENKTQTLMLPEDELFQKCGGRTAHKGARHGLKLNGKLARVEEQERLLLEKYRSASTAPCSQTLSKPLAVAALDLHAGAMQLNTASCIRSGAGEELQVKSKKKKSKKRKREEMADQKSEDRPERCSDAAEREGMQGNGCDDTEITKKKKKRKKEKSSDDSPGGGACAISRDVKCSESSRRAQKKEPGTEGTETKLKELVNKRSKKSRTQDTGAEDVGVENTVKKSVDSERTELPVRDSGAVASRKSKKKKKDKESVD